MGIMAEIRGALAGGASREQLELSGYQRSSVCQAQRDLAQPGDGRRQTAQRRAKGSAPNQVRSLIPVPRAQHCTTSWSHSDWVAIYSGFIARTWS